MSAKWITQDDLKGNKSIVNLIPGKVIELTNGDHAIAIRPTNFKRLEWIVQVTFSPEDFDLVGYLNE